MALIETGTCKISNINNKGLGVGSTEMGVVELPYTLPGDVVEFERHKYRYRSNCITKQITELGAKRENAPCEFFYSCGGCLLQHVTKENYLKIKLGFLENTLAENKIDTQIKPIVVIEPGNRRRVNMSFAKKNDRLFLGFFRFRSNQIINIDKCIAVVAEISEVIAPFSMVLKEILENGQKGEVFITKVENGIDIAFEICNHPKLCDIKRQLLLNFAQANGVIRLLFRYRKNSDIIFSSDVPFVTFDSVPVEIDSYGFLQASAVSDKVLTSLVLNFLDFYNCNTQIKVADLFCGYGTFTIPLSNNFTLHGFENETKSITALKKAVENTNRNISVYKRDLFTNPLSTNELNEYKFAVVNPPRSGMNVQAQQLSSSSIQRICYISCNVETFAQDAKNLISGGYKLVEIVPVDQFYWSPHLEVVALFAK